MGSLMWLAAIAGQAGATPPAPPPPPKLMSVVLIAPGENPPDDPEPMTVEPGGKSRLTNLRGLITQDDYPATSLRLGEEGAAVARIEVAADGKARDCTVTESSGSEALDAATCRVIMARGRFLAARDAKGKPIADTFVQRVRWMLPAEVPHPFGDAMSRLTLRFDSSGTLEDCVGEPPAGQTLELACERSSGMALAKLGPARLADRTVAFETGFMVGKRDVARTVGEGPGKRLIVRGAAALKIAPDGRVIDCEIVDGARPGMDVRSNMMCTGLTARRYAAADDGEATREGVDLMAVYFVGEEAL